MDINKFVSDGLLKIRIIPNSKKTELKDDKLYLKSAPEKGKANRELIKFFKKKLNMKVEIIQGKKSRDKTLKILG